MKIYFTASSANKNSLELFTFYENLVENTTHPLTVLEIYSVISLITHLFALYFIMATNLN